MALNPVNPIQSGSATATNGSPTISVTGGVDCSFIVPGFILQLGTRRIVTAISGTAPVSGTSTITLAANWDQPTTTDVLIGWNSYESLPNIVNRIQNALGQQTAIGELTTSGLIEKTGTNAYQTVTVTTFAKTLLDDADAAAARTTLGAQASDATLTAMAGVTTAANKIIYFTGVDAAAAADLSAYGRTLIAAADAAAARTALSAQALDATLTAMAGVTTAANKIIYFTGVDAAAAADLSAYGRTLIAAADAATARNLLGVGTAAQSAELQATVFSDFRRNRHSLWEQYGLTSKLLTDIWTTTRTGNATYNSPVGIKSVGANIARIEYDTATGEARGLLCEAQRTRLNTVSAVVTAPENITVTAAAHTMTFYGTGTVALSGAFTGSLVGTGASNRVTLTFTPTAGTLTITPTGTVTGLQIELGAGATSLIQGEGAAQTRPVSQHARTITDLFNKSGSTVVLSFLPDMIANSNTNGIFGVGSGAVANALTLSYNAGAGTQAVRATWYSGGGSPLIAAASLSSPLGSVTRAVMSFNSAGTFALAINGTDYGTQTATSPDTAAWVDYWLGTLRTKSENAAIRAIVSDIIVIPRWISSATERAELSRI